EWVHASVQTFGDPAVGSRKKLWAQCSYRWLEEEEELIFTQLAEKAARYLDARDAEDLQKLWAALPDLTPSDPSASVWEQQMEILAQHLSSPLAVQGLLYLSECRRRVFVSAACSLARGFPFAFCAARAAQSLARALRAAEFSAPDGLTDAMASREEVRHYLKRCRQGSHVFERLFGDFFHHVHAEWQKAAAGAQPDYLQQLIQAAHEAVLEVLSLPEEEVRQEEELRMEALLAAEDLAFCTLCLRPLQQFPDEVGALVDSKGRRLEGTLYHRRCAFSVEGSDSETLAAFSRRPRPLLMHRMPPPKAQGWWPLPCLTKAADWAKFVAAGAAFGGSEGAAVPMEHDSLGRDLLQRVRSELPSRPGVLRLAFGGVPLLPEKTLQEQGVRPDSEGVFTYTPTCLLKAWHVLKAYDSDPEDVLEGTTKLIYTDNATQPQHAARIQRNKGHPAQLPTRLPSSLRSLSFGSRLRNLQEVTLPSSLQSLAFGSGFDQSLQGITFPDSLQSLTFGDRFNRSLQGVTLPDSLQILTFGLEFDTSLHGVTLPCSLRSLTFGDKFNQCLQGVTLPDTLQSLTFGGRFNQDLQGAILPSGLQSLTFGNGFTQSLEGLAWPALRSLTFGNAFNHSLGATLPSLQSLKFGAAWDQILGATLPSRLQSLTFGKAFNRSLRGVALPELQSLTFGDGFNQSLFGVTLPDSLQSLKFGEGYAQSLQGVTLPGSLQSLAFGRRFGQNLLSLTFPGSLQSLSLGFIQSLQGVSFPGSLRSLTFEGLNQGLQGVTLPDCLQSLTFGREYNHSLKGVSLPKGLHKLNFGFYFNQGLQGVSLPDSLQSLTFGFSFDQRLQGVTLPATLQSLTFGHRFNQRMQGVALPDSLQILTFGFDFDTSLQGVALPDSLQILTFGDGFNQCMQGVTLPDSLQSLTFGCGFHQSLQGISFAGNLLKLQGGDLTLHCD
ncbi:unnamed protein product, partial [Effrenium voratum]